MLRHLILAALVASCQAAGTEAAAQDRRAAREACHADYQRHCAGVTPGQGRIVACLKSHIDQLSPVCRAVLEQRLANSK
jgi:hypothetical protein